MEKRFNVMQSADSNSKVGIWYVNDVTANEINEAVYAVLCHVAQEVLDRSTCFISGDRTAAELAGTLGSRWCPAVMTLTNEHHTMADETCIRVGGNTYDRKGVLFECHFKTDTVFEQMAEWEGVMSLSPKKYHRFGCECKQESFSREPLKPYTRCHQPKPSNPYSAAQEAARINKKFEVIGPMSEALGSDGMKRALSVLTAIESIKKLHGYDMADMAGQLLRRKLWREYGKDKYQQPMVYTAKDFEPGPEVWKQVDEQYAKHLMAYFREVLAASPAPKWPKKGDMVQMKNQGAAPKKWQGRLEVYEVRGSLDMYHDKINWYAVVCTTKGKHDSMTRSVDALEPWTEPEKPKKPKAKKASGTNNSEVVTKQSSNRVQTTAEPTLAERLREALLRQFAMAA